MKTPRSPHSPLMCALFLEATNFFTATDSPMNHFLQHPYNRRAMIRSMIAGSAIFPGLLSQLLAEEKAPTDARDPLAPKPAHFPASAKRVIFLFMNGGVSHVDSWDPKPRLFHGAGQSV